MRKLPQTPSIGRKSRQAVIVAGCCLFHMAAPVPSSADVAMTVRSPGFVSLPGPGSAEFSVGFETSATAEHFGMIVRPPELVDGSSPFAGPPTLSVDGAALGDLSQANQALISCSSQRIASFGFEPVSITRDVDIPPNAHASVHVRYTTGPFVPWNRYLPGISVELRRRLTDGSFGTSITPRRASSPRSSVDIRRRGILLRLRSSPMLGPATARRSRVKHVRVGHRLRLSGTLNPKRSGVQVDIFTVRRGARHLHRVARRTTDVRGRISTADWRPTRPGFYEVWARAPSHRTGLVPAFGCPLAVFVDRR
jgi:hypothetical protein